MGEELCEGFVVSKAQLGSIGDLWMILVIVGSCTGRKIMRQQSRGVSGGESTLVAPSG